MAIQQKRTNALHLLRYSASGLAVLVAISGCAIGNPPHPTSKSATSPTFSPIHLISAQEEQMLKEATDRAQRLHAQLRELEARNVTISRRLPATTDPQIAANDQRLATTRKVKSKTLFVKGKSTTPEQVLTVTEKLEPETKFFVEFAAGSSSLDEANRTSLMRNLGITNSAVQKIGGNTKTRVVIQLATYEKNGLDRLNRDRLKTITDVLKEVGIQAEAVKLKTKRVEPASATTAKGSASRLVRITKLEASTVRS
jgi:hypothetical protein